MRFGNCLRIFAVLCAALSLSLVTATPAVAQGPSHDASASITYLECSTTENGTGGQLAITYQSGFTADWRVAVFRNGDEVFGDLARTHNGVPEVRNYGPLDNATWTFVVRLGDDKHNKWDVLTTLNQPVAC